ncbi:hypothetical protein F4859DRAFT_518506 [Xylaria cf. heliscus]|nr:hypothetical protein F4859DRAFT_518506 [Xylaria cf. heliscus]
MICLQPFMQYEGLVDRREHESRFSELQIWVKIALALGTDMVMIPANSIPKCKAVGGLKLIVKDLWKAANAKRIGSNAASNTSASASGGRIDKYPPTTGLTSLHQAEVQSLYYKEVHMTSQYSQHVVPAEVRAGRGCHRARNVHEDYWNHTAHVPTLSLVFNRPGRPQRSVIGRFIPAPSVLIAKDSLQLRQSQGSETPIQGNDEGVLTVSSTAQQTEQTGQTGEPKRGRDSRKVDYLLVLVTPPCAGFANDA